MHTVDGVPMIQELKQLSEQYNQLELAERLGISQSYVSMLLTGKRQPSTSLTGRIKRLYSGTEIQTAKWDKKHGAGSVVISLTCPHMTAEEKTKLAKVLAYYASAYMKAEVDAAAGIPSERPRPLP
jgi:transcriptional regulator with XRE-family HTH domain